MDNISKYTIDENSSIIDALEKINIFSDGQALVLFAINKTNQIVGSLTDGDIRRGLLQGFQLTDSVKKIMFNDFHYIKNLKNIQKIKKIKALDLKIIPHVTEDKTIIRFINLKDIKSILPIDAVIMAGGKGIRPVLL